MKKTYLFILVSMFCVTINAQNTLNFCKDNVYNYFPATASENFRGHFGLPGASNINFHLSTDGINFGNIFQLIDDTKEGHDAAKKNKDFNFNKLNMNLNVEAIGFGFRVKKNYFTFSNRVRAEAYMYCPRDVAFLLIDGLSPHKGEYLDGSVEGYATVYNETAIGFQRKFNNIFSMGVRAKFLIGIANLHTKTSDIGFLAQEDGTLIFKNNLSLLTAIPGGKEQSTKIKDLTSSLFKSYGGGFDLGFNITLPFGLEFRTSALDIGWIRWNDIAYQLNVKGKAEVTGYDLLAHKLKIRFPGYDAAEDSLFYGLYHFKNDDKMQKNFEMDNGYKSYTTMTYPKLFLEASYNKGMHKLAFLARFDFVKKRVYPLFTFGYNLNVRKVMDVAVSYSIAKGYYENLGLALSFNIMDVLHIYVASDNIIAPFTAIKPLKNEDYYKIKSNLMNIQAGIYFTIPQSNKVVNTSLMRTNL